MQTLTQIRIPRNDIAGIALHQRHGQDLAILGKPRDLCQNSDQAKGYDVMVSYMAAFARAVDTSPCCNQQVQWAADLEARKAQAQERYDQARAANEHFDNVNWTDVVAEMEVV